MLNIEIKGVQFSNKGAELMLEAILQQLDLHLDEYQLTLSPGRNLPYVKRAKLGAWQKLSFRRGNLDLTGIFAKLPKKMRNFLKRYGIVTEADVDVILNASGFAYGDQWPLADLRNTAKEIKRFKALGKPYILLPQALGPFQREELKEFAESLINDTALTFARDDTSFAECEKLNKSNKLFQSPDFTALLEVERFNTTEQQTVCLIPNNKMVSKFNHANAEQQKKAYYDFWIDTARFFIDKGFFVKLLNHEGKEDRDICNAIFDAICSEQIALIDGLSSTEIKALIGSCDAVVSSRFHGCVSALCQGVPCLATSWSHKYEMLYGEYGLSENVIDFQLEADELKNKLNQFLNDLTNQASVSLEHAEKVKLQNKKMWQQVVAIIKS
ncbi:polysaccharide pyruvyl transferase family protein [Pseudoalteromonas sp. G4]|uniref:polysaccharide pyruvyl transferase family protein n=1 Tax=Pseudoalteromonas sp. G4 TaxID=2992761 RepID=UPI00237D8E11|nr:polysaccharide pyruvyl transferase family protein [Pseudoalteromonas sp. G4]MDE3271226.1 polysaccharide pyruvyl transferase family protein [Pseudoalteromonas sp. G4]